VAKITEKAGVIRQISEKSKIGVDRDEVDDEDPKTTKEERRHFTKKSNFPLFDFI
jgi:hypothetical protein